MGDGRWAMGDGRWAMGDGRGECVAAPICLNPHALHGGSTRLSRVGAGLLLFVIGARAGAQDAREREYKTVLRDTSIHPLAVGYDFQSGAILRHGAIIRYKYQVVTKVWPGTPAEEAGLKPGDEILSINGFDLATQHDSARFRLANVPTPLRVRRDDTVVQLMITPRPPAKP